MSIYLSIHHQHLFSCSLHSPLHCRLEAWEPCFPDTFAFGSGYNLYSVNEIISCKILQVKYRLNETIYEKRIPLQLQIITFLIYWFYKFGILIWDLFPFKARSRCSAFTAMIESFIWKKKKKRGNAFFSFWLTFNVTLFERLSTKFLNRWQGCHLWVVQI